MHKILILYITKTQYKYMDNWHSTHHWNEILPAKESSWRQKTMAWSRSQPRTRDATSVRWGNILTCRVHHLDLHTIHVKHTACSTKNNETIISWCGYVVTMQSNVSCFCFSRKANIKTHIMFPGIPTSRHALHRRKQLSTSLLLSIYTEENKKSVYKILSIFSIGSYSSGIFPLCCRQ